MAISLRDRTLSYLKRHQETWINGGEFERMAMQKGYKGSTVSRELRRLAEESRNDPTGFQKRNGGVVRCEERNGPRARSVWYCFRLITLAEVFGVGPHFTEKL